MYRTKPQNQPNLPLLGKLPPQAPDLEEVVLGRAVMQPESKHLLLEKLSEGDFYLEEHREIFKGIAALSKQNINVEPIILVAHLRKTDRLNVAGGPHKVLEITKKTTFTEDVLKYCLILIELRVRREMIHKCMSLMDRAYNEDNDVFELVTEMSSFPTTLYDSMKGNEESNIGEIALQKVKEIQARTADHPEITGVPSGLYNVDRNTGGFKNTDFIVIGARPGMGKTTLSLNILRNAAVDWNMPVSIFSLEMSKDQLTAKALSIESGIGYSKIQSQLFTETDWERFNSTTGNLIKAPIIIDDKPGLNISEFRTKARRHKQKYGIRLIVVDYLQLMHGEPGVRNQIREQEISSISRGLKEMAKELNIPIIALTQLSRKVEERGGDKRPQLSDIRESGAIEQDADMIGFMWRPMYYKITGDDGGSFLHGATLIDFKKFRNGKPFEAWVGMDGETSSFKDIDSAYMIASATPGNVHTERAKNSRDFYERKRPDLFDDGRDRNETPF